MFIEHSIRKQQNTLSSAHGTSPRIELIFGHKSSLSKFKKTENISGIISNHNTIRSEIRYKKKTAKPHKYMEAEQYATQQPMDHQRYRKGK